MSFKHSSSLSAAVRTGKASLSWLFLVVFSSSAIFAESKPAVLSGHPLKVLFFGDSLTSGYTLGKEHAYPALLQNMARDYGYKLQIDNGGVDGETTAAGARRIKWTLREPYDIVVVALGANDALRGVQNAETERNLVEIIESIKQILPEARVFLASNEAPPNMGSEYTSGFRELFVRVASKTHVELFPFLLEGVAGDPQFNLDDRMHPNARGHKKIAERWWRALEPAVKTKLMSNSQVQEHAVN